MRRVIGVSLILFPILFSASCRPSLHEMVRQNSNIFPSRLLHSVRRMLKKCKEERNCSEIINEKPSYRTQATALGTAAHLGAPKVVAALLDAGGDVSFTDLRGRSPLLWAAHCLLRKKVFFNSYSLCPNCSPAEVRKASERRRKKLLAVQNGRCVSIARSLISRGADPLQKDENGVTAVHVAAMCAWTGDKARENVDYCLSFLDALRTSAGKGKLDFNVLETGPLTHTPLHYAALRGNVKMVHYLLKHGASANPTGTSAPTPIAYAAACSINTLQNSERSSTASCIETIKILIRAGANVNTPAPGRFGGVSGLTPLHLAAATSNIEAIRLLLKKGAYVNPIGVVIRSKGGFAFSTPLRVTRTFPTRKRHGSRHREAENILLAAGGKDINRGAEGFKQYVPPGAGKSACGWATVAAHGCKVAKLFGQAGKTCQRIIQMQKLVCLVSPN